MIFLLVQNAIIKFIAMGQSIIELPAQNSGETT